jgi:GT2 family glycosyltransferase
MTGAVRPDVRVAAIIPHWNRVRLLETMLPHLDGQARRFDRIIVIDNGSTDGSGDVAERAGAHVIRLDRNIGFAAAVNRGIAAAGCDWLAILNNDLTLDTAWLERLIHAAVAANASFATGKTLNANDHSRIDGLWDEVSRGACSLRCGSGALDDPKWNKPRKIRMASMTASIFRRELFYEIGFLDERFESYLEDVDFGLRCAKAGHSGIYEPSAVAYHQGSATFGRWQPRTVWLLSRNQVFLAVKHFSGQPKWPLFVGQILWGFVALRHRSFWAWVRGKFAGRVALSEIPNETHDAAAFTKILQESEAEILRLQRQPDGDMLERYWRWYAWLAPLR